MIGSDLERAVAAVLQASGWFLLRGATDETFQAFELDVVGYRFDSGEESSVAVESKGGKSGFNHLWKLVGLKTHLGIQRGVLLADDSEPLHDRKISLARRHDVSVVSQDPADLADELVASDFIEAEPDPAVLLAWLRCFRVEDGLAKTLNDKDLWQRYETIQLAKRQLQKLTSKVWLEPDPWRQAVRLYSLYQDETKIARRMAEEKYGAGWQDMWRQAMYHGSGPEIQACFYLEHRKRLAVAFAATRCAAFGEESRWVSVAPWSFRSLVEAIADEEAWWLPAALQVYFLGFGAMICTDDPDAEYGAIGEQAGCTPNQARRALELFADLFPSVMSGGWYYDDFDLSRLKLVPAALRGSGTWMREAVYERDWSDMATAEQLRVVGSNEVAKASEAEQSVLPRRRRLSRIRGG
jgi:hypothetical protein